MARPMRGTDAAVTKGDPTMGWAIEARDVCKRFDGRGVAATDALRGVDLEVAVNEFVAIMGPSGCGKSTLLHILAGLDRPTAGEVHVAGQRIDTLDESARAVMRRALVGFVFQAYNLVPNLSVADNVDLPGLLARRSRAAIARRRDELLERLGVAERSAALPAQLSGGEQQRVALARALINEPAVLLADEPTGNLDSAAGAEVMALLDEVHRAGQSIVLVTHEHRVAAAADRIVFMRDGSVVEEAPLPARGRRKPLDRIVRMES